MRVCLACSAWCYFSCLANFATPNDVADFCCLEFVAIFASLVGLGLGRACNNCYRVHLLFEVFVVFIDFRNTSMVDVQLLLMQRHSVFSRLIEFS